MKLNQVLSLLSIFLLLGNQVTASIIISEVLVDGTDEFIELYNPDTDFSGSLILEGAKSSAITLSSIQIPSQGFYLLGDNGTMLQGISLQKSGLSLNLTDTSAVNLLLKDISGGVLDSFVVDASKVTLENDKKLSFQKYLLDGVWLLGPTSGVQVSNAIAGFTINPGLLISLTTPSPSPPSTGSSSTGDTSSGSQNGGSQTGNTQQQTGDTTSTGSNTTGSQQSSDNQTGSQSSGTGNITGDTQSGTGNQGSFGTSGVSGTGETTSGVMPQGNTPLSQENLTPIAFIQFQEIHPGNDSYFKEYLELWFDTAFSGSLRIVGGGHRGAEKIISVNQGAKSRLLLGGEDFGFGNTLLDGLSLTDGGENLTLIGQDGQVLDTIVYQGRVKGKSLYRGGVGEGGVTKFDMIDVMTPGYTKEQVKHLLPSTSGYILPCGIEFQNRTPRYAGTSMNIAGLRNNEIISNSDSSFTCSWKLGTGMILSNQCNPNYIQVTGAIFDDLQLEVIHAGESCAVTIPLNIPEKLVGSSSSSTSSLQCPAVSTLSSSSNSKTYYGEYQLWRNKFYDLLDSVRLLGFDLSTSKLLSMDERVLSSITQLTGEIIDYSGSLSIARILPNPKGKDGSAETIELASEGTGFLSGVYLSFASKIFPLRTILLGEQVAVFSTGFGFPNDGACVELKLGSQILDRLCYPKARDGERYSHSGPENGSGVLIQDTEIGLLHFKQTANEICIYMDTTKILCEPLELSSKDKKHFESTIKKLEKKLASKENQLEKLEVKLDKKEDRIDQLKEKQQLLIAKSRQLTQKYRDRRAKKEAVITDIRGKNTLYRENNQLQSSYIGFLEELLYDERPHVTDAGFDSFMKTRVMYGVLEDALKKNPKAQEYVISPYLYGNTEDLLALGHGEISEKLLDTVYPELYQNLMRDVEQIQKNMTQIEQEEKLVKLGKK